jgi:SNW domain-containing protein 1
VSPKTSVAIDIPLCRADIIQVHINDNFAKFSEALFVADRHAREEVRARSQMQQLLAQKEKTQKEENLRLLAREERSGLAPTMAGSSSTAAIGGGAARAAPPPGMGLGGYASESEEEESEEESEEDEEAVREREQVRAEKRREREKEMRMSNMGSELRAKMIAK